MYWIFDEASEFECRCFYIIGASTKCYKYKEIAFPVKLFDIVYRFLHTHTKQRHIFELFEASLTSLMRSTRREF